MIGPPATQPEIQEARGGKPQGNPKRARITNPVLNQSPVIRRKDAERLVSRGRAEWVAADQLRLVMSHPQNRENAAAAATEYNRAAAVLVRSAAELRHVPVLRPQIALTNRSTRRRRVGPGVRS
jgi:hypothetical protein